MQRLMSKDCIIEIDFYRNKTETKTISLAIKLTIV